MVFMISELVTHNIVDDRMPTDAVIPSTPLSLLPFLSKINEQWTSDLETPQAQARKKPPTSSTGRVMQLFFYKLRYLRTVVHCPFIKRPVVSLIFQTEETPKLELRTPDVAIVKSVEKIISDSPVIASKATRRRSKRRIFRSSIDPLAVTNNEDITVNVRVGTPVISANFAAQRDTNAAVSDSSFENTLKNCEPKVLDRNRGTRNNEEPENFTKAAPDSSNTSTQEFFDNASFSKIDELCSNTFDDQKTMETTVYNDGQNIGDIDEKNNVEKNIGFFTARGASINVSKQALLKAKRLFADTFDETQNYESVAKRNPNEEKNLFLPSSSFANNVSVDVAKQELKPLTELKSYDKESTVDCKKPLVNKSPEEVNNAPVLFSTANGNPINISKEALLKVRTLLADELDDDDVLIKYCERSSADKNPMTVKNVVLPSLAISSKSVSKKSPPKARLFAEQSDTVKFTFRNKVDISDNEQCDINTSNIGFCDMSANSEQVNSKARELSAEQIDDLLEPIATKKVHNDDDEMKRLETKVTKIGFQTAGGKAISVSEQALAKAKALFVEHLDDTLEAMVIDETDVHESKVKEEAEMSNIRFQSTGSVVDVSERRSKANMSFEQLDDRPEPIVAKATKIDDKAESGQEIKIPSVGFQTARGTSINISERALSRARALFADQLDCPLETDILENTDRDDGREMKKRDLIPHGGLQTASGQRIPVSDNAALIARELFCDDCLDESNPDLGRASLQKRKLSETNVDESTPQGRNRACETKKARLGSEIQARKLFPDSPTVGPDNDELRDLKEPASTVADSVLESPKRDAVLDSNRAGSPVIGRQPASRKRKSLGYQKDEQSALRGDRKILSNAALQGNVVQESAPCGKIEDDKLNARTQTQVAGGNNAESSGYGDTQVMMDFIDESTKILRDRLAAALEQEAIITAKRRHGSKQSVGQLYRYKQINSNARRSLREIAGGAPPAPRSHQELVERRIAPEILEITAATAATHRFRCSDFYGNDVACNNVRGIETEDGARLILDESGHAGVWELLRAFLASPGVDPNLVPARWVENHYRWIVWKLASMDRMKFGSVELPRYNITKLVRGPELY